jgi:hypothetical protein
VRRSLLGAFDLLFRRFNLPVGCGDLCLCRFLTGAELLNSQALFPLGHSFGLSFLAFLSDGPVIGHFLVG